MTLPNKLKTIQKLKDQSMPDTPESGDGFLFMRTLICFVLIATGILYSNTLNSPFVLDDHQFILDNYACHITRLTPANIANAAIEGKPANRLIPNVSLALNYYFNRYELAGYHVVNIAIHLLAGIFLFFFIRGTLRVNDSLKSPGQWPQGARVPDTSPEVVAFFSAMIWLVHPVATESVTYVCQRMTSIVAMFYILSMMLYLKGRMAVRSERKMKIPALIYFVGCLISGVMAITSKENAATLPLFILLYEWFFFQNLKINRSTKQILWMSGAAVVFISIAMKYLGKNMIQGILAGYSIRDFTLPQRVLTEFRVIVYYISLFLWPSSSRLNLDHHYPLSYSFINPWTTAISILAVIVMLFLAIYSAKKDRLLSFCILWFLGNLAIESSVIGIEIIFEHRTYLPFMVFYFMLVLIAFRYIKPRILAICALSVLVVLFSSWTCLRNQTWNNSVSLWKDCVKKSPQKFRPHVDLGVALFTSGDTAGAIAEYKKALEIIPGSAEPLTNIGNALFQQNRIDDAIFCLQEAIRHSPDYIEAHIDLGNALLMKGMTKEAIQHFETVLKIKPDNFEANVNIGSAFARLGDLDLAISHYRTALSADPENPKAFNNLGVLYTQKKMYDEAISFFKKALQLDPDYAGAQNNIKRAEMLKEKSAPSNKN